MTPPEHDEEGRRRRSLLVVLFFGAVMLLLGVLGGWLAFGQQESTASPAHGARPASPAPSVDAVRPPAEGLAEPSAAPTPLVVVGTGQAQRDPQPVVGTGPQGRGGTVAGNELAVSSRVTGTVGPGQVATLVITITNVSSRPVVVTGVTASVTSVTSAGQVGKPTCTASWYRVGSFSGARTVARNETTTVSLGVTFQDLATVNQDNCKGSTYTYAFTVAGRQP